MSNLKIEHYILGETLGIGAFGKVKLAKHEFSGSKVAIKIINKRRIKNNNMSAKIKREIRLLRYFNNPYIIRLYEVLETQSDIFVVMEYVPNGELFGLIAQKGKLPEDEARFFFQQIISGVEYCHSNLVAHRDLKPENILIDDSFTVKIGDFGLSNLMKDGKFLKTSCGSPNYAAPEVISGKAYCGTQIDTWSCGVILFALLAGYVPFDEEVIPALFKKIREADYQVPSHFSPEATDIINKMLQPDVNKRIPFSLIKNHPWVKIKSPMYVDINQLSDDWKPNKLNDEVLSKVLNMQFNFEGFNEYKVKEAIHSKRDYSFVIAYDLMCDEIAKKHLEQAICKEDRLSQDIYTDDLKKRKEFSQDYDRWHYGLRYDDEPLVVMRALTESLVDMDTTYIVKKPSFKIKCFYKVSKSQITPENPPNLDIEYSDTHTEYDYKSHHYNSNASKHNKKELCFTVQLYVIPNQKGTVVDIQKSKGHTLMLLAYCQKLVNNLNFKLKNPIKQVQK